MPINKRDSFPCEGIGQIRGFRERRGVSIDFGIVIAGVRSEETKELIETPIHRIKVRGEAQMPFADSPADVARRL